MATHPTSSMPVPDELFAGPFGAQRRRMIREDLWGRDIRDARVLEAMARVPRHEFLPPELRAKAYADHPVEIGFGQTISQPYMVARMSELAEVRAGSRVLEIGVGSGYQTAVLLELGALIFGVEIMEALAERATATLARLGYADYRIACGDGSAGLAEEAPFDVILLAAAPGWLPCRLLEQLTPGGRLVAPVGPLDEQYLYVYTRQAAGYERRVCGAVRFVPMLGAALGWEHDPD